MYEEGKRERERCQNAGSFTVTATALCSITHVFVLGYVHVNFCPLAERIVLGEFEENLFESGKPNRVLLQSCFPLTFDGFDVLQKVDDCIGIVLRFWLGDLILEDITNCSVEFEWDLDGLGIISTFAIGQGWVRDGFVGFAQCARVKDILDLREVGLCQSTHFHKRCLLLIGTYLLSKTTLGHSSHLEARAMGTLHTKCRSFFVCDRALFCQLRLES